MRSLLLPVSVLLAGCTEYELGVTADDLGVPLDCELDTIFPDEQEPVESCPDAPGGFVPIVEWGAGQGRSSRSVPAVADLDGDGKPEIVANFTSGILPGNKGDIVVLEGDGTVRWSRQASLGYASGLSVGDLDHDGAPEIVGVKALGGQLPIGAATYAVVAYDRDGNLLWESDPYDKKDFDYATGIALSDMDHDGSVEIVAGRVILRSDGTLRGKGDLGRGSWGEMPGPGGGVSEGTVPAVADLDLDGIEEVITGNTFYTPEGDVKWHDPTQWDGMVGIANLDDDPEGEVVVSSFNTVRAIDTDGTILWGPHPLENANIVSPPAIADLDGEPGVEIVVAGGNQLAAVHADGTLLWSVPVVDMSGATGASIFDFEGDGLLEVVYIDEQNMSVYDGATGEVKFFNAEHNSDTMMDYPVIADVDADGQAEIVVAHANFGRALSVYGDEDGTWAPARRIWNQHAYSIGNVEDDLDIPTTAEQGFTTHNTWHSAIDTRLLSGNLEELGVEILDTCETDCEQDSFWLIGRVVNRSDHALPEGIPVALYALRDGSATLIATLETDTRTPAASTGDPFAFEVAASAVAGADAVKLVVDDDGSGLGYVFECDETDNAARLAGPFCE